DGNVGSFGLQGAARPGYQLHDIAVVGEDDVDVAGAEIRECLVGGIEAQQGVTVSEVLGRVAGLDGAGLGADANTAEIVEVYRRVGLHHEGRGFRRRIVRREVNRLPTLLSDRHARGDDVEVAGVEVGNDRVPGRLHQGTFEPGAVAQFVHHID